MDKLTVEFQTLLKTYSKYEFRRRIHDYNCH